MNLLNHWNELVSHDYPLLAFWIRVVDPVVDSYLIVAGFTGQIGTEFSFSDG